MEAFASSSHATFIATHPGARRSAVTPSEVAHPGAISWAAPKDYAVSRRSTTAVSAAGFRGGEAIIWRRSRPFCKSPSPIQSPESVQQARFSPRIFGFRDEATPAFATHRFPFAFFWNWFQSCAFVCVFGFRSLSGRNHQCTCRRRRVFDAHQTPVGTHHDVP